MNDPKNIAIVGLGYVGLPLAVAFAKVLPTVGFDVDGLRVDELSKGFDRNREVDAAKIESSGLSLSVEPSSVKDADFIIVTVPTPISEDHKPDLSLLESASAMIGAQLRERSEGLPPPYIVFESTTYPGCTEHFCAPVIEHESGLLCGQGFFLGYSPERINFGDEEHTLETVTKVVSGQTPEVTEAVARTYSLIAKAGVHRATNIKTAEASKVIENVQRDLNIALFNELAMIFDRLEIVASDVFDAAATKWNFHRYQPGLVGGHCIPVDPYYLTHVAEQHGYNAVVILGGRNTNEGMVEFVVEKIVKLAASAEIDPRTGSVLVLGQTFKKDVADQRNSKAIQLTERLSEKFADVTSYDPLIPALSAHNPFDSQSQFDVVVVAVPHTVFLQSDVPVTKLIRPQGILVDLAGEIERGDEFPPDIQYWKL